MKQPKEIIIVFPESTIIKIARMIQDNHKVCLDIRESGNCITVKRLKHPTTGEPFVEIHSPEVYLDTILMKEEK